MQPSERVFVMGGGLRPPQNGIVLRLSKPRTAASIGSIALVMTTTRYRCDGCGNLTRFDLAISRRTREFHHFTVGGDLEIESIEVVEEEIESVQCRWCGAQGDRIHVIAPEVAAEGSL